MKLSRKWIEEYTEVSLSNEELTQRIGSQLGAIEGVEDFGAYYDDAIIVAEITAASDHPDADKLGLYTIAIDDKGTTRQLVAGDKSLAVGSKVAYIPPGADVPASRKANQPFTIRERELRGVTSQGMLGSGKELIINDDHTAVLKLDTTMPVGTSLKQAYQLDDFIIDIENKMFTHRPDLFGILGLAREIAGIQGIDFKSPPWFNLGLDDIFAESVKQSLPLAVANNIPEGCPRFTAVVLDAVTVCPSPIQAQSLLQRVGLRPINNVVDATNYIMYLTAQPSHAFDYDKIKQRSGATPTLQARMAHKREKLTLLDGREVELDQDVMVVATDKQAVSIGGSIGGADTEVDAESTRVIIEVANWDLYSIRRTSFKYGIFTDAVTRYNKGQSSDQARIASAAVVKQIIQTCNASVASELFDEYPSPYTIPEITLDSNFVNTRLGSNLHNQEIADVLRRTEITSKAKEDSITVAIPFWRTDLHLPEDLVEEVGRLIGFDNLPVELPYRAIAPNPRSAELSLKHTLRQTMSAAGATEVLSYNFVSEKLLQRAGIDTATLDKTHRIRNSISPALERMRPALAPSLLDKVTGNIRQGYSEFALFEINKSHNTDELNDEALPHERTSLSLVYCNQTDNDGAAFYRAKGYLEHTLKKLGVRAQYETDLNTENPWQTTITSMLEPKRSARITANKGTLGFIGEPSQLVRANFKLPLHTALFEIDLAGLSIRAPAYKPISKFPASKQDITLEVPNELTFAEIERAVKDALQVKDATIALTPVTIYRSSEDTALRRITFAVTLQSQQRTLTTKEVNQAINVMASTLKKANIKQI